MPREKLDLRISKEDHKTESEHGLIRIDIFAEQSLCRNETEVFEWLIQENDAYVTSISFAADESDANELLCISAAQLHLSNGEASPIFGV